MAANRLAACGIASVMALAAGRGAQAATEPAKGIYDEYQYVLSVSSSPAGLSGCSTVGETFGGRFHFPGPGKAGAFTTGATEVGTNIRMQICKFPDTPLAGGASYSGTEHCTNTYLSGSPSTYTESFSWVIAYVDASSFLAQKTITYPTTGGTCTEVRNVGFEATGK